MRVRTAARTGAWAMVGALVAAMVTGAALAQTQPQGQGQGQGQGQAQPGSDAGEPSTAAPPGALQRAGAAAPVQQTPDTLLGDAFGIRPALADVGVVAKLGYKGEIAVNAEGGQHLAGTETGQGALSLAFDPKTVFGIEGGTAQLTLTYRNGSRLGDVAGLNVLQQVQEVYGRGQTFRLTELWYQQSLAHGAVVLKGGRFPAGDFNTFDCDFMNLTFCGAPAGNLTGTYWFNYPIARWAAWAKFRQGALYFKAGVAEDNRNNLDEGLFLYKPGIRGAITNAEVGWTPGFAGGRLPGRYQAGAWRTSGSDPDVLFDATGRPFTLTGLSPRKIDNQDGLYVQMQQQLTGEAKEDPISGVISRVRGVSVFANFTRNDPDTATTLDQETAGFYLKAPFAGRPKDQVYIALGRTHYNGRAAQALLLVTPGVERPRDEYVLEADYALAVIPGFVLRPNLQYIRDPGGLSRADDVVVAGLRFDVDL